MQWESMLPSTLRARGVQLTRGEELKLQEEFIARNGVKKLPPVWSEAELARWERIRDFRRELQKKYQRQD